MSNSSSTSTSSGIGVSGLLGVVFVVLKLIGEQPVADWSWLWVLSPFWIPCAILLAVAIVCGLIWLGLQLVPKSNRYAR